MNAAAEILMCCPCGFSRRGYFAQCPQCRAWNTCHAKESGRAGFAGSGAPLEVPLEAADGVSFQRVRTGIPQLDEALSGGFVPGTSTIFFGEKNCGKTTLALQAAFWVAVRCRRRALYLTNEQAMIEINAAVKRLDLGTQWFNFANPADLQTIHGAVRRRGLPSIVVIDSLQGFDDCQSVRRGEARRKQAFIDARNWGQQTSVPMIWVSQVNADAKIKGGPFFGHEANAIIKFRQRQGSDVRELYVDKNRSGKAQFAVTMTMTAKGLV